MRLVVPYIITDDTFVSSTIAESDAAAWSAATTYALAATVMVNHRVYESLQASNLDHDPATSPLWWLDTGPTNRWAMFDGVGSAASTASGGFTTVVNVGPLNDIVLTEIAASSVTITLPDTTITRSVPAPVAPATTSSLYITDIASDGGDLSIAVSGSGDVSVGSISIGTITVIGQTQHGSGLGIIDYSRRSVDQFGSAQFTKRGYSKRLNARVTLPTSDIDRVANILTAVRSVPVVWIPTEVYTSMFIVGYFRDWEIEVTSWQMSTLTLTIESVVQDSLGVTAPPAPDPGPGGGGGGGGGTSSVNLTDYYNAGYRDETLAFPTAIYDVRLANDGTLGIKVPPATTFTPISGQWLVGAPASTSITGLYEVSFEFGPWLSLATTRDYGITSYIKYLGSYPRRDTRIQIRVAATGVVVANVLFSAGD